MNIILFHYGKIHNHIDDCVIQIRKYFSDNVYLLTDQDYNNDGINIVKINNWPRPTYNIPGGHFWNATLYRFWYISQFLSKNKFNDVLHIENDILIFSDPKTWVFNHHMLNVTRGGPEKIMPAVVFGSYKHFIDLERSVPKYIKAFPHKQYDMLNDMTLLDFMARSGHEMHELPVLPDGHSTNLFDPCSYGQYLGGTPGDESSGRFFDDHIIANYFRDKSIQCVFENGKPYVINVSDGRRYELNNLHVHSKNLRRFM